MFNGTETFSDSEGLQSSIASLESGKIDIYASMTSLITNMPVNGTYYNTVSTATWLKTVPLEKTSNGYIYNAILADNQVFQVSPNGIEVSIDARESAMTNTEELEGTTLNVYSCMVKEGKPLGPRETMRIANLSSPSVAYWHLQKLDSLGLITKNDYGEYVIKEKVNISGHLWIGKTVDTEANFLCFLFHWDTGNRSSGNSRSFFPKW